MIGKIKDYVMNKPALKRAVYNMLVSSRKARPRTWTKWFFYPFIIKRGKGSFISAKARLDIYLFHSFSIGPKSIIEDLTLVNNAVGAVNIGKEALVGYSNLVLGPVTIEDYVITGQHVILSGLNHVYDDINVPIKYQPIIAKPIVIKESAMIGANSIINAGITVGKGAVVASGSVVTKDVPDYTLVGGNPAKPLKRYDFEQQKWIRTNNQA